MIRKINHSGAVRCVALACCAVSMVACKQVTKAPDWSTYQGNREHTGFVPVTVDPAKFSTRWSLDFLNSTTPMQVAANSSRVFISRGKQLYSIDNFDGSIEWSKDFSSRNSLNPPAIDGQNVYVQTGGHGNSFLWAYNIDSAELVFQSIYDNQWSSYYAPTVDKGEVFIAGGYYGGTYAFNAVSGMQDWFYDDNQYENFTPAVTDAYSIVYTGEYDPHLVALDRKTGQPVITIPDPNFNWNGWSMDVAPVVGSQNNVLAIQAGRLINFDLGSSSIAWELSNGFTGQPSLAKNVIYDIANGTLEARRESDGQLQWEWSAGQGGVTGRIVVLNNLLFVRNGAETHAIDLSTHQSVWRFPLAGELSVQDGTLYISADMKLVAIDLLGDTDGDGILDGDEVNLYHTDPKRTDTDGDWVSDADEINLYGSNPLNVDSDGDLLGDFVEIENNLNPNDPSDANQDADGDGFSNRIEIFAGVALCRLIPILAINI